MKTMIKFIIVFFVVIIILILIALLFIKFYPGIGKTANKDKQKEYESKTKYFYKGEFHNIEDFTIMTGSASKSSNESLPNKKIPVIKWDKMPEKTNELSFVWLGHSSLLLQMNNKNILIDPVLSDITSPVSFIGVKRFSEIPIKKDAIDDIDILLISHDHYDHLDYPTIKKIDKKVKKYVVPYGVENYLIGWGVDKNKISTVGWWDKISIDGIEITSTPARHYTGRNPLKRNISWWCGYYLNDNTNKVYYTGDSGYSNSFKDVYEKLGSVDILFCEDGQYNNAWKDIHMSPEESLKVSDDVKAKYYIPVHFGAFKLSTHAWYEPVEYAYKNKDKYDSKVITPMIGDYVVYSKIEEFTHPWWRE